MKVSPPRRKASHGLAELIRDTNAGELQNAYVLTGDDADQRDYAFRHILNTVVEPATRDFNCDVYYGDETDGATLLSAAASFPMMATRRFVGLKNAKRLPRAQLEAIADAVPTLPETTVLAIDAGGIDGRSSVAKRLVSNCRNVVCRPLSEDRALSWLMVESKRLGLELQPAAARLLIASQGVHIGVLTGELAKLDAFVGERRSVTEKDVRTVVGVEYEATPYGLADAIGERDVDSAITTVDALRKAGFAPTYVLSALSTTFLRYAAIRGAAADNAREIAQLVGVPGFAVSSTIDAAHRFTSTELRERIYLITDAERRIKTGLAHPYETLLEVVPLLASRVSLGLLVVG
jgi:DNA polymerase-3 subunit delta